MRSNELPPRREEAALQVQAEPATEELTAAEELQWLCAEAVVRIKSETSADFLIGVEPLNAHIQAAAKVLNAFGITELVPIALWDIDHTESPFCCYGSYVYYQKNVAVCDPFGIHGFGATRSVICWNGNLPTETAEASEQTRYGLYWIGFSQSCIRLWGSNKGVLPVHLYWPDGESPESLKAEIVQYLERWVRFLTETALKLANCSNPEANTPQEGASTAEHSEAPPAKPTRATKVGKGDQTAKIVAWLTKHHEYESGSVHNYNPAESSDIREGAKVPANTVSDFLKREFPGGERPRAGYVQACRNQAKLLHWFQRKHDDPMPQANRKHLTHDPDSEAERF